jgi:hypothetical protein
MNATTQQRSNQRFELTSTSTTPSTQEIIMNATTQQRSELTSTLTTTNPTQTNRLEAQWQTIDGKLVCQWKVLTGVPGSNLLTPNFAAPLPQVDQSHQQVPIKRSRSAKLVATWSKIDGQLVCQWHPAPASGSNLRLLEQLERAQAA